MQAKSMREDPGYYGAEAAQHILHKWREDYRAGDAFCLQCAGVRRVKTEA